MVLLGAFATIVLTSDVAAESPYQETERKIKSMLSLKPLVSDEQLDSAISDSVEAMIPNVAGDRQRLVKKGIGFAARHVRSKMQKDVEPLQTLLERTLLNRNLLGSLAETYDSSEAMQQHIDLYNEVVTSRKRPKPQAFPKEQFEVKASKDALVIAAEGVLLVSDRGTSGDSNGAIDAGETITLNIPIRNVSTKRYISTSGFLQSDDKFVTVDASEVVYDEIEPNQVRKVPSNYTFTISPNCPDGHECLLRLLTWDTDYGKSTKVFTVTVCRVGPLSLGSAEVDDDMPGPSDGNGDKVIDAGETIEFRVNVKNEGIPDISRSKVRLVCQSPYITFNSSELVYSKLPGETEQGVRADFDFTVAKTGIEDTHFVIAMVSDALCRGHSYRWIRSFLQPIRQSRDVISEHAKQREEVLRKIAQYPLIRGEWFFGGYSMEPKGYKHGSGRFTTAQWVPTVSVRQNEVTYDRYGRRLKWHRGWEFRGSFRTSDWSSHINGSWRATIVIGDTSQSAIIDYKGSAWGNSASRARRMATEVQKMQFSGWRIETKAARFDPSNPRVAYSTYFWLYQKLTDAEKLLFEAGKHPRVVRLSSKPLRVQFERGVVKNVQPESEFSKYLKVGDKVSADLGPGTRRISSDQMRVALERVQSQKDNLLCLTVTQKAANPDVVREHILFVVPASLWNQ